MSSSLFDLAFLFYGSAEGVEWLLEDNPDLSFSFIPEVLSVRPENLDDDIKAYYERHRLAIHAGKLITKEATNYQYLDNLRGVPLPVPKTGHIEFTPEFNYEFN